MMAFLQETPSCRTILVEKTDRLYRNFRDCLSVEDLGVTVHFVKENTVLSPDFRSSDKLMHNIKLAMAWNYVDNLSEEVQRRDARPSNRLETGSRLRGSARGPNLRRLLGTEIEGLGG